MVVCICKQKEVQMRKYKFSSINPNTKKIKSFVVIAKDLQGAEKKAALFTMGHIGLKLEIGLGPVSGSEPSDSLVGKPVLGLAQMLRGAK